MQSTHGLNIKRAVLYLNSEMEPIPGRSAELTAKDTPQIPETPWRGTYMQAINNLCVLNSSPRIKLSQHDSGHYHKKGHRTFLMDSLTPTHTPLVFPELEGNHNVVSALDSSTGYFFSHHCKD